MITSEDVTDNAGHVAPVSPCREDSFIQRARAKGAGSQLSAGLHWHCAERGQQDWIGSTCRQYLSSHSQGGLWKYDQMKMHHVYCVYFSDRPGQDSEVIIHV